MATLPEFLTERLGLQRGRAFAEHREGAQWCYAASTEVLARAQRVAAGLRARGVGPGDRVALIADNGIDWLVAAFGTFFAHAVCVPVFRTSALDQLDFIFRDAEPKLAFVHSDGDAARIAATCPHAPPLVAFSGAGSTLAHFEASAGAPALVPEPAPDELAVLIYTSGTTGEPKGVMLSHDNLLSNARATHVHLLAGGTVGPVLSVLPFAHVMALCGVLGYLLADVEHYISTPDTLLADLRSVRPRTLALVPRIFERMRAGIVENARATSELRGRLVSWALAEGLHALRTRTAGRELGIARRVRYALAKRLVLEKIRPAFGLDRAEFVGCGSAPLHRDLALLFASFGVPVCEGYGLTEAGPVVTATKPGAARFGTVGTVLPGVRLRLASDGEIEVAGPGIMRGYYRLPQADAEAFSADGWLRTGDVGTLDADGYLTIVDRKKELFKTGTGKYVAPSRVEAALRRSVYVAQALVVGDGRPFPAALVAANLPLVRRELGLAGEPADPALTTRSDVHDFLEREAVAATVDMAPYERIRYVVVLPRELTVAAGELSPTMKIKRRVVERAYASDIEALYARAGRT